jgi:hypothetical protein
MTSVLYPLDITGKAASNLVTAEIHLISDVILSINQLIIPTSAPFFLDKLSVIYIDKTGAETTLKEDIEYSLCLPFIGATRDIGKSIYGGILILPKYADGSIKLSYQVLGDKWTCDTKAVLSDIVNRAYNPRKIPWDKVSNVTDAFMPLNHEHFMDFKATDTDLVNAVKALGTTLATNPGLGLGVNNHKTDTTNPHLVGKYQVGLGNVANYPIATDAEVLALAEVDKYVTLKQIVNYVTTVVTT